MPKREKTRDPQIRIIGKSFYFRGYVEGSLHEAKLGPVSMGLAMAKLKRDELLLKAHSRGLSGGKLTCGMLFTDYIADREEEHRAGEIRDRTIEETKDFVNRLLMPFFKDVPLYEVEDHWERFRKSFGTKDPMNPTKVLRHFMRWCRLKKYIRHVPQFPLKTRRRRPRVNLTEEEVLKLLPCFNKNTRLVALICLLQGFRPGEAIGLSWDRVDFKERKLILTEKDTKTKTAREVPMNSLIFDLLSERKASSKSPFVFPKRSNRTQPMHRGAYLQGMAEARTKAKLDRHVTMHDLRATFEHWAHANPNFSDTQLEKMLGAKIDVQRRIYVKMGADQLKALADAVQIKGLKSIFDGDSMGNTREKSPKEKRGKRASK